MKILQIIPYFNPRFGGDVNVCYMISKYLAMKGHQITIITTDYKFDNDYANSLKNCGVKIYKFHCIYNISFYLISPEMKSWLHNNIENFDILHIHTIRSYQSQIVSTIAIQHGIPYIVQPHGALPYLQKMIIKKLFDFVIGHRIINQARAFLAITDTEANFFHRYNIDNKKIFLIDNGIDFSSYEKLPEKYSFKKRYGFKENDKIILYLGRLHKTKGIDLLISSLPMVLKNNHNIKLVIIGPDYGYKHYLISIIYKLYLNNNVFIFDFISEDEKKMAFVDSDIFVTPTYSGFPITFLEAAACGAYIITTERGDTITWIKERYGQMTRYNKNDLALAITDAIENNYSQKQSTELREFIHNNFNWPIIINKLEIIYNETMNP